MTAQTSPLGQRSAYIQHYDAGLLFPIPRADKRAEIGISPNSAPIFFGADVWTAYELSWLNRRGKPQVALAQITLPCESPNILESKSMKLYFNSFNQTMFDDAAQVQEIIQKDLSFAAWQVKGKPNQEQVSGAVRVKLLGPEHFDAQMIHELSGLNLDRLDIDCSRYEPAPHLLHADASQPPVSEVLTSRLLKSNCLVTGQPDWGSVQIAYHGHAIDQETLLQYLVSFRNHNEFHEQCVERIFMDIWKHCKPEKLLVYARYTRRGGLDINPFRTSHPSTLPQNIRTARQ